MLGWLVVTYLAARDPIAQDRNDSIDKRGGGLADARVLARVGDEGLACENSGERLVFAHVVDVCGEEIP